MSIAVILFCLGAPVLLGLYSRVNFGRFVNPATLFAGLWGVLVSVYEAEMLPYNPITFDTWVALAASAAAFLLGCYVASLPFYRRRRSAVQNEPRPIRLAVLTRIVIGSYVVGTLIFAGFLYEIEKSFTLEIFIDRPSLVRKAIGFYEVSWFLKYFYFTMPAAVLAVFHIKL